MIILTPNRRLTAFSLQQFNQQQFAAKRQCWETPEIYPIEVWLQQIWNQCLDHNLPSYRPLLSGKQQQLLFEQIIQNNMGNELLRVSATAQSAIQAWSFLKQYQVDLRKLAAYAEYTPDPAAFYAWLQAYLLWLDEHKYYDFHLMVDRLINLLPEILALLPQQICLRGFNELTPQYTNLITQLKDCGIAIAEDHLTTPGAKVFRTGFENAKKEILHAALWAQELLAANEQQTIGIVVPELEQMRDYIYFRIARGFLPEWLNISAPLSLSSYDLISSALLILKVAQPIIDYNDCSILLRCPYIAGFLSDCSERAQLDRKLRAQAEAKIAWTTVMALMEDDCRSIKSNIENFVTQFANLQGKHSAYYWAEQIQVLLQCWGWPGDQLAGAEEWQQSFVTTNITLQEQDLLSCWRALLEEYCKLSIIIPQHTFSEALQLVRRIANETSFLPAETGITKIHILGLLEAEGLVFDHLWVCGMSREAWPLAANPNPFIPVELQREYDLPHSSAQRELAMAQKYTVNLQQGGKQTVIFSYPKFVDEYGMQPSNLITHLPEEIPVNPDKPLCDASRDLEIWHDNMAPPYTESYIGGGAASLKLQAQCPFKATAELRLKAKPLEDPQQILTPMARGSLVHEVLEAFWRQCQSHAQLVAYAGIELEQILSKIIQDTLQAWQHDLPYTLTNNYIMLEAHRLFNLIARWLEYEKTRSAFVVYQLEQKTLITIAPLQINMKIDRIDQVGDNYVIIDYKTGETNKGKWYTDPIYEPQLPIYAVSVPKKIAAVTFASLRSQDLKFSGVAMDDGILPHVKGSADWDQLQQDWRQKLQQTAQDFAAGIATVTPYSPEICNYCSLHALCRIYEQQYE